MTEDIEKSTTGGTPKAEVQPARGLSKKEQTYSRSSSGGTPAVALLVSLVLIGLDQLTKWLAVVYLMPVRSIPLISVGGHEVLNFTYVENTGAAFGIFQGQQLLLIAISCAFVIVLLGLLFNKSEKTKLTIWSIALVVAGGTGNLIDRVISGYVVDFIDFKIINFPVFNLADICAVVGATLMLCALFFQKKPIAEQTDDTEKTDDTEQTDDTAPV
ncbi:MAG: signal peptidase II [Oscillospiraceae bacterium]|nr:signal peptidase II [Oscillospiraceae bacterium]